MATMQDCSIGYGVESAYKTFQTPSRRLEFVDESLGWNKNIKQGQGLKVGSRVARTSRRVIPTADGAGDITHEAESKGMGILWRALLGVGTSTNVSGATYQQLFTFGDSSPDGLTIQKGLPLADGTVTTQSWLGCMATGWEFSIPNADIASLKISWDAGDITLAEDYEDAPYPTGSSIFHFANAAIYSGTLTAPTTTALASATTPLAGIRSFSVGNNNNPDVGRFNLGGSGRKDQPLQGMGEISGSLDAEYISTDFTEAVLDDADMSILVTLTTPTSLSTGVETLQIAIPSVKFDNELAKANGGNLILQSMNFAGLDNSVAPFPLYVVHRTSDTAL